MVSFLFLLNPGPSFGEPNSPSGALELYLAKDYKGAAKALDREDLSPVELYLAYKTQQKLQDHPKAYERLKGMNDRFTGPLRQVVLAERMEYYDQNNLAEPLLSLASAYPRDIRNSYLEKRLGFLLGKNLKSFADKEALRAQLEAILDRFPSFKENPKLLQLYLSSLPPADPKRNWTILQLYQFGDYPALASWLRQESLFIRMEPIKHKEVIYNHFNTQFSLGNFTYLREGLVPAMLVYRSVDRPMFLKLRGLYFRSFFHARQYGRALQELEDQRLAVTFDFFEQEKVMLKLRLSLLRGKTDEAKKLLELLQKKGFEKELNQAYFLIGEAYFADGAWVDAFESLRRVDARDFEKDELIRLQWKLFLVNHRIQHVVNLERIATWAQSFNFEDDESAARFCYWGYKLGLYQSGTYLSCFQKYPETFYGLKSKVVSQPFGVFSQNSSGREFQFKKRPLSAEETEYFEMVNLLYRIEEDRLADALVLDVEEELKDLTYFEALKDLLAENQRFYTQYLLVMRHREKLLGDEYYGNHFLLPLRYPLAYGEMVAKYAKEAKVEPALVFAVMREESRFRPYVKSPVGAVGLLQLMPKTAQYVGRQNKLHFRDSDLINPELNLHLGTKYLNSLQKTFKGNLYYTLAAYNGGGSNVKKWQKNTTAEDMDYFVELITFKETKDYVKRVLKSYYLYQQIYGPL